MFFPESHEKSAFSFKSRENRYPESLSRSRSRSGNFLKVGAGAEKNSFGSATLLEDTYTGVQNDKEDCNNMYKYGKTS
jgi:hypothetical protein